MKTTINETSLAVKVAEKEGGVINLPIAQIKEVQKHLLDILAEYPSWRVLLLLEKHKTEE